MYTSGTTGAPKGAMLTHGALARNARTAAEDLLHLTPEDVVLAVTPLFHVGGMWYHLFPSFAAGCSTVLMKDFEPRAVIDALQRHRASCVHLVPTMIHAVIEQPDAARLNFDHLRLMYYAASPIPPELLRRAMKVFSKSGFVQSYGSTEAGIVTGLTPEDHIEALREPRAAARLASCGRAVGKIGLRVVDSDGNTVAPGVIGEVQVKSDRSMVGYWNNAAATRAAMADGWFATGDLGRLDEDGYVTLVDRKHDMIVSGGENVYPVEVEAVLYRDPRILEAAVFGMPDPRWVEKVAAAIVLRPGAQATAEDIIARARTELAGYKCPKTVIFAERLPRNATGKVLKKELRRVYGAPPSMQANTERAELMSTTPNAASPGGENVKVEFEDGIAWVILNRPEKRNAMSPALNREMIGVLDALELDERCKVLVLTGAGESFSAGMDLKEYFRETDQASPIEVMRVRRDSMGWQWRRLMYFPKPTIAMVNGWCFGGAFTPLVACDLALAAHEATFGLSEINWPSWPRPMFPGRNR